MFAIDPVVLGSWLLLAVAGVMLYVCSRSAATTLDRIAPEGAGRALGHWLPMAAVALLATARGEGAMAVGVIFSTSIGCVALVMGLSAVQAPLGPAGPASRRMWCFLLPVGVLVLLIGLRTAFAPLHALLLAVQGVVILMAMQGGREAVENEPGAMADLPPVQVASNPTAAEASHPVTGQNHSTEASPPSVLSPRIAIWLGIGLAGLLALIGGWAATEAVIGLDTWTRLPLDVLTTGALSALLILPVLGAMIRLVHHGRAELVGDVQMIIALLNFCLLLPLVIVLWTLLHDRPLLFPMRMWRVDAIVLTVVGLLLLPVALGRWRLSRHEGVALVIGFGLYLMAASMVATR